MSKSAFLLTALCFRAVCQLVQEVSLMTCSPLALVVNFVITEPSIPSPSRPHWRKKQEGHGTLYSYLVPFLFFWSFGVINFIS